MVLVHLQTLHGIWLMQINYSLIFKRSKNSAMGQELILLISPYKNFSDFCNIKKWRINV